jgi:hypothetical protein
MLQYRKAGPICVASGSDKRAVPMRHMHRGNRPNWVLESAEPPMEMTREGESASRADDSLFERVMKARAEKSKPLSAMTDGS